MAMTASNSEAKVHVIPECPGSRGIISSVPVVDVPPGRLCGWCERIWRLRGTVRVPEQCLVDGCERPSKTRGWCGMHYSRIRRRGTAEKGTRHYRGDTIEERLRLNSEVDAVSGCWVWQGYVHPNGYGRVGYKSGWYAAHRVAYEVFIGPIPDGMHIDHVAERGCRDRRCINPAHHLEAVTQAENNRRAREAMGPAGNVCGEFRRHRFFEHQRGPTLLACVRCGTPNPKHVSKHRRAA